MRRKALFIAYGALLAAVSVVLKLYGIPISEGGFLKDLNLSPVVIMFSGITLGPVGGALVGAVTDIMASLIRPLGAYVPWFTITSALMGLIPGLFFIKRKKTNVNADAETPRIKKPYPLPLIIAACVAGYGIASVVLNTLCLIWLGYFTPAVAWARNLPTVITLPIYVILITLLLKLIAPLMQKIRNK